VTGLSSAWLDRTLKKLHQNGLIEYDLTTKTYAARKTEQLRVQVDAVWPVYLREVAERLADELADDARVRAIVLFGSVVRGEVTKNSDIDLLVILEKLNWSVEEDFRLRVSELGFKFDLTIEPVFLGSDDFRATLEADVGLIFGLARGYVVLRDQTDGALTKLLNDSVAKVQNEYFFVEEGEVWLPRKELTAKA
jgi:predicted nucleotidyltransferase